MKLLGWDTSSKTAAIVALEWDEKSKLGWDGVRLVAEWTLDADLTHSERLLWGVHQVLQAAHWKLEDVGAFAVGVGPGSFTGLRIGITTARTLSHTLNKPLIRVSSLAALARPVAQAFLAQKKITVIACTDACKGELFAVVGAPDGLMDCVSMAEGDEPGIWKRGVEEKVLSPDALLALVKKKMGAAGKWTVVGEGRARYADMWKKLPASRELAAPVLFSKGVQGRYLGLLAWESYQAGIMSKALRVFPRYLRVSDAEIKLKAGLLPPGPTRGDVE